MSVAERRERFTDLLDDPVKAKRYGEAGRKRVEGKFAWSAIASQTVALYQNLKAKTP